MTTPVESNENWNECPKCGRPVLVDPATSQLQPCAYCNPTAKRVGLIGGMTFLLVAIGIIILLIVVAIAIGSFLA